MNNLPGEFDLLRKQFLAIRLLVLIHVQLQRTTYLDIHHHQDHQFHELDLTMDSI